MKCVKEKLSGLSVSGGVLKLTHKSGAVQASKLFSKFI